MLLEQGFGGHVGNIPLLPMRGNVYGLRNKRMGRRGGGELGEREGGRVRERWERREGEEATVACRVEGKSVRGVR